VKNRQSNLLQNPSDTPALREYPSRLFVETTSRCNLSCFMCVKQTRDSGVKDGDLTPEAFTRLEPALPNLEALVLNGVGEPLLHPHLEEFIRRARRRMPERGWIGFQSNALLLNESRALSLTEAGLDRICLSLDSVSADTFRKVREGGELLAVDRALSALESAAKKSRRPKIRPGVEFVLMRDNLHELPEALRWAARRGAEFAIVTHLLPYDEKHADQAAYGSCTEASIELFETWKKKAAEAGVDLCRYFEVIFKYAKSDKEQRIVGFVEQMKTDAGERGISFDLKKLLQMDRSWLEEVAAVFEEARGAAEEMGLDLRLPEIVPQADRHCHFVEDGGAFISWDGGIHPCYFLWHRYNCFAGGWNQIVKPKIFGSLAERGILEIWNDVEFRSFRESVLEYDYPYCSSCTLAPCDYVQTEEFEQDCHVNAQPCGSCLWCMGLFQCLR